MSFAENLANVVNRYDEISSLLSSPDVTPENLVKMNKELAELGPVVEAVNHYRKAEKDLNDVLEVRLGLEELAVKLACQRITESELQKLYQASRSFEQMLETTETDDLQKLAQADVAFHDVIYQATNNERLIQLLNNLREQMYRYRIEYLKDVKSRRSLVEEHDALYERMKNRDLAGAQKMIREHIERQQESIMQTVHHQLSLIHI